jgi:hypothetical protein
MGKQKLDELGRPEPFHLCDWASGEPPQLFERYKYYGVNYRIVRRIYNNEDNTVGIYGVKEKEFNFNDWVGSRIKGQNNQKIIQTGKIDKQINLIQQNKLVVDGPQAEVELVTPEKAKNNSEGEIK